MKKINLQSIGPSLQLHRFETQDFVNGYVDKDMI